MRRGGGGRRLAAAMAATAAATAAASPGPPAVALCANDPVSSLGAMLLEDERRSSLKVGALRVAGAGAAKPKDIMRETIARKRCSKDFTSVSRSSTTDHAREEGRPVRLSVEF